MHQLIEILNHPTTGAFGQKIPGSNYSEINEWIRLIDAIPSEEYEINSIPPEDQDLLSYLVENNIIPGTHIKVSEVSTTRGVISIEVKDQNIIFSELIASKIYVSIITK